MRPIIVINIVSKCRKQTSLAITRVLITRVLSATVLSAMLLPLSLILSVIVEAQSTYPNTEAFLDKGPQMRSRIEYQDSFSQVGIKGAADSGAAIEPGSLYDLAATIYTNGDSSRRSVIVSIAIVPGHVYNMSGTINGGTEPSRTPFDVTVQQQSGETLAIAKNEFFSIDPFSKSIAYFTRVQPAVATSLRYWKLEDGSRQAEDYRYTVDPYVRLFKQSERWSWDNLYQMKLGVRWGEVSDDVLGIKLNTDYVRKVQSRSEYSVRGRYERTRGLTEEILIGDISFVDHDLFEAAFGFNRGKGRDRVHFDSEIYARVVDYDDDIDL
jgi:hypothetical protein